MRTLKKLSILSFSLLILVGCGGGNENAENPAHKEKKGAKNASKEQDHNGHKHGEHPSLKLNDGKKWEADSSTKAGVEQMQAIVKDFPSADKAGLKAHHELADTLKAEFDRIFKHCSMKGPGHQQLHNYLLPIKKDIQGLRSEELQQAKRSRDSIEKRLPKFEEYFE